MTIDYPDRIDRLVACATNPAVLDEVRFECFERTMKRILSSDIEDVVQAQATSWLEAGTDTPNFDVCLVASKGVTSESAAVCLEAIRGWDVRNQLSIIDTPVLIISGDSDHSVSPETLVTTRQAYPNGQLAIVPGCTHMVYLP